VKHKLTKLTKTVSILQCLGHTKFKFVLFKTLYLFYFHIHHFYGCEVAQVVPTATQSKAQVCGRSPAEIVCSNPTGGVDVCLFGLLCVAR